MDLALKEAYMRAYLFELEEEINSNPNIFRNVNFQLDEANTDKGIKTALKELINSKCNRIRKIQHVILDENKFDLDISSFEVRAKIPEDYSKKDKEKAKEGKESIFVEPDMILICKTSNGSFTEYLELKSTKGDKIPGSSVQQVIPNEWVLFVKRSEKAIESVSGQYKDSISGIMRFPDRSPRPEVSFNELKKWLMDYRSETDSTLEFRHDEHDLEKQNIFRDWQEVLSDRWLEVLKNEKKENEPWFNNALRKFALQLLNCYESLSLNEREAFKSKISKNINQKN